MGHNCMSHNYIGLSCIHLQLDSHVAELLREYVNLSRPRRSARTVR